jgi:hypothetical protein
MLSLKALIASLFLTVAFAAHIYGPCYTDMTFLSREDYARRAINSLGQWDVIVRSLMQDKGAGLEDVSKYVSFDRFDSPLWARILGFYRSSVLMDSKAGSAIIVMDACGFQVERFSMYRG